MTNGPFVDSALAVAVLSLVVSDAGSAANAGTANRNRLNPDARIVRPMVLAPGNRALDCASVAQC